MKHIKPHIQEYVKKWDLYHYSKHRKEVNKKRREFMFEAFFVAVLCILLLVIGCIKL